MKRAVHAVGALTAALATVGALACGSESSQPFPTGAAATRLGTVSDSTDAVSCSEAESLALLRLQHLRALHLAIAMRDRLEDPKLRAFGDRLVEEHMNLVNELDTAMNDSAGRGARRPDGGALSSDEDMRSLGDFTDRAMKEIAHAEASDVERIYVHHQLGEHMHAIGLIDHVIMPSVGAAGRGAELVRHGRELFATHARHLFHREAALAGICAARAVH